MFDGIKRFLGFENPEEKREKIKKHNKEIIEKDHQDIMQKSQPVLEKQADQVAIDQEKSESPENPQQKNQAA